MAVIEAQLKLLPGSPGVYRMLDANGEAVYVGKARNLKKRVANYATPAKLAYRLTRMVAETEAMEFVTTHTEVEALLLESNLIKRLETAVQHPAARRQVIPLHPGRGRPSLPARGQASAARARSRATITAPLPRPRRWRARWSRCSAPSCCATARTVSSPRARGPACSSRSSAAPRPASRASTSRRTGAGRRGQGLPGRQVARDQDRLAAEMQAASTALDFEQAARLRDRIRALAHVQGRQDINIGRRRRRRLEAMPVWCSSAGGEYGNRACSPTTTATRRSPRCWRRSWASSTTTRRRRGWCC